MSFSGFSRSSASAGYCSGGIGLGAHHFRHFQFPYIQVSLPMSLVFWGFAAAVVVVVVAVQIAQMALLLFKERHV